MSGLSIVEGWQKEQDMMAKSVNVTDTFDKEKVNLVAGVDISFQKENPDNACAFISVYDLTQKKIVYEDFTVVTLSLPYVSGFLGFREVPSYLILFARIPSKFKPDVVLVDGYGILHQRGAGSATQLGFSIGIPTVGVGKTLMCVDGLVEKEVKKAFRETCVKKGDFMNLVGKTTGKTYGVALSSSDGATNPIYISAGYNISLATSVDICNRCSIFKIPEPIRNSDIKSKLHF